jgi:cytochrome P450
MYALAVPTTAPELVYNPYSFAVHDDPYETYRRMRDHAPAYWNPELRFWALSRFTDVLEGFRDFETFSSAGGIALENRRPIGQVMPDFQQMIELDPPEHTVFRSLVSRVFTGRRVADMEDEIRRIFDRYLDAVIAHGSCDLVDDITSPYPMDVICSVLGVPEADRAGLRAHADRILIREDGSMAIPREAADGMFGVLGYFIDDLPRRRAGEGNPGLVADLLDLEVDGRALTEQELLGFCVLFVIAGHETTTKMVANSIEILSRHPEQRDRLVADPSLIPGAVEEVLRFHNSTQYMHRTLTRDLELHGEQLHAGDSVLLLLGAANHDEREFGPTAEEFDITRRPDRHLAFGYGAHFCLGAALARIEGKVALEQIHRRIPDYAVDHEHKVRFHSSNVTGWTHLPITFTPGGTG